MFTDGLYIWQQGNYIDWQKYKANCIYYSMFFMEKAMKNKATAECDRILFPGILSISSRRRHDLYFCYTIHDSFSHKSAGMLLHHHWYKLKRTWERKRQQIYSTFRCAMEALSSLHLRHIWFLIVAVQNTVSTHSYSSIFSSRNQCHVTFPHQICFPSILFCNHF